MSYSFREPEEPADCECKYDDVHDRMDREDCPFHADRGDYPNEMAVRSEGKIPIAEETHFTNAQTAGTA